MATKRDEYDQKDSDITTRNRVSRAVVAIVLPILTLFFGYLLGAGIAAFFKLPSFIGMIAGIGLGNAGVVALIPRLYVVNEAIAAFMTVDLLTNTKVSYGPGFNFSFPWEAREGANNVNLKEVEEKFSFTVQTKSGTINGKGSFRLRPDITRLPEFLAGAGSVAADLGDLLSAHCVRYLAELQLREALGHLRSLNVLLQEDFKHGESQDEEASGFEKRFGVMIGDVTVSELLPSKEVQKAMDGASEREALDDIVARNLGYASMAEVHAAVKGKALTSEQVAYATENALAMTDNLHGMSVKRESFTLRLQSDPGIAEAIKEAGPGALAALGLLKGKPNNRKE